MIATITRKGQITLPLAIRKRLRLKAGGALDFDEKVAYLNPVVAAPRSLPTFWSVLTPSAKLTSCSLLTAATFGTVFPP